MIQTENLSKLFGSFQAVWRVNLAVKAGEVLALLGPNGAGKTTTVRMLASVLPPSEGSARVAGFDVVTQPKQVRASVGVLTENHGLYNRMPAGEYLDFFGQVFGLDEGHRNRRINHLLDDFGLLGDSHRQIGEFSKGMRQKLALARALLHQPPVLLLDEPTSAMDPESARLVRDSIHTLRSEDRAIILCTHNLVEAEELADRIAIINEGRIIADGSPSALKMEWLGAGEYRVEFVGPVNGAYQDLPPEATVIDSGPNWIHFATRQAAVTNPQVIRALFGLGLDVISLYEVPRSLEAVYLRVVESVRNGGERHV